MKKKHRKNCSCPICNNSIREERQYGVLPLHNGGNVIIDIEELSHLNEYMESLKGSKKTKSPEYTRVEPKEDNRLVLVYGVLIPQYDTDLDNWEQILSKYKEYAFVTLAEEKLFLSAYKDFKIFEEKRVYEYSIPCALLLDTSLDLSKKKEYGFGYTSFLRYKDLDIFTNILNRQFLFCLGEIETSFNDDLENWKKYINKEKLINVAKRLF